MAIVNVTRRAQELAIFGDNSRELGGYLQNQLHRLKDLAVGAGNRIYDSIQNSFNSVTDSMQRFQIRRELNNQGVKQVDNYFEPLTSLEKLRSANVTMQRWVMAHPTVKKLYLDQNCAGYPGSYNNISGNSYGEEDYDYRRIMDGIVVGTDDGGYEVNNYYENLMPGDRDLDFEEQLCAIDTHEFITELMKHKNYDFTAADSDVEFNR